MAKTAFDVWFDKAVEYEGKVNEDVPGDGGGPTRWGVTIGRLATIKGVREPKRGTAAFDKLKAELFALTEDEIRAIYKRDYWDAVRGDELPPGVNFACADFGLNSGPSRGVRYLQKLCGNPQTGKMDDETIREAHEFNRVELILLYQDERAKFLNGIVASRPNQRKFLKGWLTRVGDVRRAAIALAEKAPEQTPPPESRPMPKAVPKEETTSVPTIVGALTAVRALWRMIWAPVWAFALWLLSQIQAAVTWIGDRVEDVVQMASGVQQDVEGGLAPFQSLGSLLKANVGVIIPTIAAVLTIVAIVKIVRSHAGAAPAAPDTQGG